MSAIWRYLPVFHDVLGSSVLPRIAVKSGVHSPAILFVGRSVALPLFISSQEDPGEPAAQSV